jgi:lysophospholipase L1-like esterase
MASIHWIGDSTVAFNNIFSYPQTGIGQVFNMFLKPDHNIRNHAKNGRSTKSFIDQSLLVPVYFELKENDFLFIQFGHNDEKKSDLSRYTDPNTTFKENLIKFINVANNKKATPVLITPLERRWFKEGKLINSNHLPYVNSIKQVAKEYNVVYVDLFQESRDLLLKLGDTKSKSLFMQLKSNQWENYPDGIDDNTHLTHKGAVTFASIIYKHLLSKGEPFDKILLDNKGKNEI